MHLRSTEKTGRRLKNSYLEIFSHKVESETQAMTQKQILRQKEPNSTKQTGELVTFDPICTFFVISSPRKFL